MAVFGPKFPCNFNGKPGACYGCVGVAAKAIGFLPAGGRAIQGALMVIAAGAVMLINAPAWLKSLAALEPSALPPSVQFVTPTARSDVFVCRQSNCARQFDGVRAPNVPAHVQQIRASGKMIAKSDF